MIKVNPTCWRCVSETHHQTGKPRQARFSKMFCTQRCAAAWATDLLEGSEDYEWCSSCATWQEKGWGCNHSEDRTSVWDLEMPR